MEQELCLRVRQHDVAALGILLERWRPWLLGQVRKVLRGSQPAGRRPSDVVQEACVLAIRFVGDFKGESMPELRAWLVCILRTAIIQTQRHGQAERRADTKTTCLEQDTHSPTARTVRLSQIVSARQDYREAVAAIARMPKRQREVLYLRLLEERSLSEIATMVEDTEQAVASLIKRGLVALRQKLEGKQPQVKRQSAARVDAALLEYLRMSDRGHEPKTEDFLRVHADCAALLAPVLAWLQSLQAELQTESPKATVFADTSLLRGEPNGYLTEPALTGKAPTSTRKSGRGHRQRA
ncbi:MAG TPA: sigma-70 family RNA polymerase sigma factor [Pseudomonadota bacterium]|nr:sigma-70 family RNA polymerase sigma factor [Pseudomonadota bacterium]